MIASHSDLEQRLACAVEALEKFEGQFDYHGRTGTAEETLNLIKQ